MMNLFEPILMFLCILFYRNKQILKTLGQYEKGFVIVSTREIYALSLELLCVIDAQVDVL